jgi:hypothetical protein
MSLTIWTQCGGPSNACSLELKPWRVRESQFINSTRKLVDSNEEQKVLEELLDQKAKPPVPSDVQHLHYLLATPFRHPPLKNGSRFGTQLERGMFYGAIELETCLAEVAYYRHVFLAGTAARILPIETQHSAFQVHIKTSKGIDLTQPPFVAHASTLTSKTDYSATQQLGQEMRKDSIEAFVFTSARSINPGTCVAVIHPNAFAAAKPLANYQEWFCTLDRTKVEFRRKNLIDTMTTTLTFPLSDFLIDNTLPQPATM